MQTFHTKSGRLIRTWLILLLVIKKIIVIKKRMAKDSQDDAVANQEHPGSWHQSRDNHLRCHFGPLVVVTSLPPQNSEDKWDYCPGYKGFKPHQGLIQLICIRFYNFTLLIILTHHRSHMYCAINQLPEGNRDLVTVTSSDKSELISSVE